MRDCNMLRKDWENLSLVVCNGPINSYRPPVKLESGPHPKLRNTHQNLSTGVKSH